MTDQRTLLLINFRSADLTRRAIQSARASSSDPLEVIVVDNSRETETLGSVGAELVIASPRNLGFAGGINLGATRANGDVLIIANPDVVFQSEAIDRLADSLRGDVGMSGPRLSWDEAGEWIMPPAESHGRGAKLSEALSTRWRGWNARRARQRLRRRMEFWSLNAPARVDAISGAVMCLRRDTLKMLGGFDERYPLYFEEIDFMRRLRRRGSAIEYQPAARCRHLYNQSAGQTTGAQTSYVASEEIFHRRWSGGWFVSLVGRIAVAPIGSEPLADGTSLGVRIDQPETVLIEASPLRNFDVAVGHFPRTREVVVPSEIWRDYRGEHLYLRVVDRNSLEVRREYAFRKATKISGP